MAKTRKREMKTNVTGKPWKELTMEVDRPEIAVSQPGEESDRLGMMPIGELQRLFAEVVGERTRCPRRDFLVRKIMEATVPPNPAAEAGGPENETLAATTPNAGGAEDDELGGEASEVPATVATKPATAGAGGPDLAGGGPAAQGPKLSKLDVPALQAIYAEVTGRQTRSTHCGSLIYRIREAQKGNGPVGPKASRQQAAGEIKVVPLRIESRLVERLDEAWPRLGLRSRTHLLRVALHTYLASAGESDLANNFAPEA